jgi:hypothetical protein
MEQLSLNWQSAAVQPANLARCKAVIAPVILDFWKGKGTGTRFHMEELTNFVRARVPAAPDSAGRILRDMRQGGELNYSVVDRRKSLYQIEEVEGGI